MSEYGKNYMKIGKAERRGEEKNILKVCKKNDGADDDDGGDDDNHDAASER